MAVLNFIDILNSGNVAMPYEKEDIMDYVKEEYELSEDEKSEVEELGITADENFSKEDSEI